MIRDTYELGFNNDENVSYFIDEPFRMDSASFMTKQEDKRLARDILFSGGEIALKFGATRNHKIKKLLYYFQKYGFESKVTLTITSGFNKIKLDLDYKDAITDGLTYFECKLLQDSDLQIIKRRKDAKINLFSSIGLNKKAIAPLVPEKVLIRAKPITQTAVWEKSRSTIHDGLLRYSNFAVNLIDYDLEDSYTPFENYPNIEGEEHAVNNFTYVKAKDNLTDVKLRIDTNAVFNYVTENDDSDNYCRVSLRYRIYEGTYTYGAGIGNTLYTKKLQGRGNQTFDLPPVLEYTLPDIPRDSKLAVYWDVDFYSETPIGDSNHRPYVQFNSLKQTITATTNSYNSVVKSLRLIEVMRYVIKSISGLDIIAPRFDVGGELYDQRLLNGNLLRGIDKPFYITLKQLEDILVEYYADYEIQLDRKVFFGFYPDFYRNEEIKFLNKKQKDKFKKTYNPKFEIKQFNMAFKNFQSQKEGTEKNTYDAVHGESEWIPPNTNADNIKEVKIETTRDAFLLETTLRKTTLADDTTSQEDDKIFGLDINLEEKNSTATISFLERSYLQHQYNNLTLQLTLRNRGEFSFLALGIVAGSIFTIPNTPTPQYNQGSYTVVEVAKNYIILAPIGFVVSAGANGERTTRYQYSIATSTIAGVNWTNQGFTTIANIKSSDQYSNLRFTLKSDIEKYYYDYLATCNLYHEAEEFVNSFYKNNPDATLTYNGVTRREGDNFVPKNPTLSPVLYKDCVYTMDFDEYITLINDMRTRRGYCRAIDNEGFVVKFYIKESKYNKFSKELQIISAEEKYEPYLINIITTDPVYININNEYGVSKLLYTFTNDNLKVRLTDQEGELLYNPIFWNRIAVNGRSPQTLNELKIWLTSLD